MQHFTKYSAQFIIEDEESDGEAEQEDDQVGDTSGGEQTADMKDSQTKRKSVMDPWISNDHEAVNEAEHTRSPGEDYIELAHQAASRMNAEPETMDRARQTMFPRHSVREEKTRKNASPGKQPLGSRFSCSSIVVSRDPVLNYPATW